MLPGTAIGLIFALVVAFQIKHFLADFPLQTQFMLNRKSQPGWEFLGALALHSGVHAVLTLGIVLVVNSSMWWLATIDFAVHFVMDRIKSGPKYLGRYDDLTKPSFWNALGIDQLVHHFTSYFIIWQLVDSLYPI